METAERRDVAAMDNLTACAIAAQLAGMSYGQYMARKDGGLPIQPVRKITVKAVPALETRLCKECGIEFYDPNNKRTYCSAKCKAEVNRRRNRELGRRRSGTSPDDILVCPNCGKEFVRGDRHHSEKYCCSTCRCEARAAKMREARNKIPEVVSAAGNEE